jgi:hypothetical protein
MCSPSVPSAPTQTSQVSIPEYARESVERTIGKAEALTESPYQAYDRQRLEGATDEQLAARQSVAGMQQPGQFAAGSQLAGAGGAQALQAGQYAPGVFAAPLTQTQGLQQFQAQGPSGVGTGMESFTGQGTAAQFMSPYMQNVVDVQKQEAIRDAQKGQLAQNLAAVRQGTYGGARQLLAGTERERNLQDQMARIQATGSQSAYDAAQRAFEQEQGRGLQAGMQTQQLGTQTGLANLQALLGVQQFGAGQNLESQRANQQALLEAQRMAEQSRQFGGTLGLQGAQAATQAGATLGQLGIGQQQAGIDLAKAQEAFGAMGQAEQQKALDLQYQDYLQQQQYPYKQLGFMSDILRGSANLAGTGGKTVYEAPPSVTSQIGGLGLAGLGVYNLLK